MKVSGAAQATVAAGVEQCLAVLTDHAAYPQWWPGCESATVIGGRPPAGYDVALRFDTHSPIGAVDCTLRFAVSPDGTRIDLTPLAGPFKRLEGGWTLTDAGAGGGTIARYALSGEMSTGLPGFVERPFAGKASGLLIDEPVAAFARRVGTAPAR